MYIHELLAPLRKMWYQSLHLNPKGYREYLANQCTEDGRWSGVA